MSFNGSGLFQINSPGQPVVTNTVISSTDFNSLTADIATGLSLCITKDGQQAATARVPFASGISTAAASPFIMTNGQAVTLALTSQTVGAATLTLPDFANVSDEFVFKTKAVTMSNKTFVAPVLGVATATRLGIGGAADATAQLKISQSVATDAFTLFSGSVTFKYYIDGTGDLNVTDGGTQNIILSKLKATALATSGVLLSGTYTPTLTNGVNVASSTSAVAMYFRVGNIVHVAGYITVDPTAAAATATEIGLSLPIASDLASQADLAGTSSAPGVAEGGAVIGSGANNRASMNWLSQTTANHDIFFQFSYLVI